jgi:hypothetical protein
MAPLGALGIRAFREDGQVFELREANGGIVSSPNLNPPFPGSSEFNKICLLAFYRNGDQVPHLVFPCLPSSKVNYELSTAIYTVKIDLVCPLVLGYRTGPNLAVGTFLFTIQNSLFTDAPTGGVLFQEAKVYTGTDAFSFPLWDSDYSDSASLINFTRKFFIYGTEWTDGMDPFGSSFGLMEEIAENAVGIGVSKASGIQPPPEVPSPNACVATGLVLDRKLTDDKTPLFCPGYELSLIGSANATYAIILGWHKNLIAKLLTLGGGLKLRCSIDPNFYVIPLLDGHATELDTENIKGTKIPWIIEIDGVDGPVVVPVWNETVAKPFLKSIRMVDDGSDLSFMPLLTKASSDPERKGSWNLIYRVHQAWAYDGQVTGGGASATDGIPANWDSPELLALVATVTTEGENPKFQATAEFPNLVTHSDNPVTMNVLVSGAYGWDGAQLNPDPNFVAYAIRKQLPEVGLRFEGGPRSTTGAQKVRMGSLDLDFTPPTAPKDSIYPILDMSISAGFGDMIRDPKPGKRLGAPPLLLVSIPFALPRVAIQGQTIPLGPLLVGGQDPVPDEMLSDDAVDVQVASMGPGAGGATKVEQEIRHFLTRDPPLVFSPGSYDQLLPNGVQPYLYVVESTARQESRRLTMRIRTVSVETGSTTSGGSVVPTAVTPVAAKPVVAPTAGAAAPAAAPAGPPSSPQVTPALPAETGGQSITKIYVVDTDPFTVAEISMPQLGAFADGDASATDGEIANWQTTEMEGARWQLSSAAAGFELRFPAQATGEAMEKGLPWPAVGLTKRDDPTTSITIDYRLGPPSRMKLQSAYFQQRYAEAPWNLRRLLGYPGQRDPGATVNWLRFELLYGLSGFTWADNMRLTELSARVGALPAPLIPNAAYLTDGLKTQTNIDQIQSITTTYNHFRQTTAQFYGRFRTRLGVYEYRQEGGTEPFAISDKIEYLLRLPSSRAQDWIADPEKGEAALRNPISQDPKASGLAGGALWGIESQNILNSIIREPHAVAGLVSRLSASALGGSGAVKAEFASGKSSIKAEVSYGRTETYIVEQIGRIGVFWNVAKHVIVYRRSVLPSDQFAAVQPVQDGRPMPRKVAEYIELLQPRRCFPENGQAVLTRGFVEASNFPVLRIPVDGSWGHDTATGWAIPLWKSDADPDIYPKPIILAELAAGSDSAAPTVMARFKDPSQLTFYTSTLDKDGADTNAWAPVPDIDFENVPAPAPAGTPTIDPSAPDVRLPGEQVRDALYDRTTFDVDAAGLSADLAAGRTGGDRIGAVIETITMMRAQPRRGGIVTQVQQAVAVAPAISQIATLRSTISGTVSGLLQRVAALDPAMSADSRKSAVAKIAADLHDQFAQAKAIAADQLNQASTGVQQIQAVFADPINPTLQKAAAVTAITAMAKAAKPTIDAAKSAVLRKLGLLQSQLQSLTPPQVPTIDQLNGYILEANSDLRHIFNQTVIPGAADALNVINQLRSPIQQLGTTATNAINAALAEFNTQCGAGIAAINGARNSANHDFAAAKAQLGSLRGALGQVSASATALVDQFRTKAKQSIPAILYDWKNTAGAPSELSGLTTLKTFKEILDDALSNDATKGKIFSTWTAVDKNIQDAISALPAAPDSAITLITTASNASATFASEVQDLSNQISNTCEVLSQTVTAAINAVGLFTFNSIKIPPFGAADALANDLNSELAVVTPDKFQSTIESVYNNWSAAVAQLQLPNQAQQIASSAIDKANALTADVNQTAAALSSKVGTALGSVSAQLAALETSAVAVINNTAAGVANGITAFQDFVTTQLATNLPPELNDFQRQLQNGYTQLKGSPTFQDPDGTLRLLRAAGAAPIVPNLSFNKDRLAYFFDDAKAAVQTSPAVALLNRVGDDLKAVGIRVPTGEILDRVIPANLQNFNFGSLFPDLAGLKLDSLFPGFRLPAIANDNVKVSHGFDQARLEAWAKVEAEVPFGQPARVFAIGPVEISVVSGNLDASIDVSIDSSGKTTRKSSGQIVGDWRVGFGGMALITFVETLVQFDDQKGLTVNIRPDKVRLDPLLDFLTEIINEFVDPDSGFHLESVRDPATGAFEGIMATIDLPLPPLAAGAFAVSNLRFGASFGLSIKDDFTIVVSAAIGRQTAPFSILVAFFTGGGWIEATASYAPTKHKIVASVSLEIVAGVGVDFSFGPCRGFVYIEFGSSATYSTGGAGLSVSVILLIYGGVDILGLLDINLTMMLSITYDGYSVIGRGELDVSIEICWCVTIDVSENITYNLTRGSSSSSSLTSTSSSLDQFS